MPPFLFLELQSKSGLRKIQHNQLLWCYNLTELQVLQHLWKTGFYCRTIMSCSSVSTQHFMTVYQEKHISHDSWDSGWGTMLRLTLSFYSRKKKAAHFLSSDCTFYQVNKQITNNAAAYVWIIPHLQWQPGTMLKHLFPLPEMTLVESLLL